MGSDTTFDNLHTEDEIGLRTPDGSIIWPPDTVQGHSLLTEEGRQGLITTLREQAEALHIPADQLLTNYLWVVRKKITISVFQVVGAFPIDQDSAAAEN